MKWTTIDRVSRALAVALMSACATASLKPDGGGVDGPTVDAGEQIDARWGDVPAGDGPAQDSPSPADAAPEPVDAAPDAAPPVDAAPPADAPPALDAAPCERTWQNILTNGAFDSGHSAAWSESPSGAILTNNLPSGMSAQSGTWVATLGRAGNDRDDELLQSVTVPATTTALRLKGFRCFVTDETDSRADDSLSIQLRTTGGTNLETLGSWSDLNARAYCAKWESFELVAATAHDGKTLQLYIHGTTDSSYPTTFHFDTLKLEAYACP